MINELMLKEAFTEKNTDKAIAYQDFRAIYVRK